MTNYVASNQAELNADIALANASGTADTITLSAGFTLTSDITPINLSPGGTLVIDGGAFTVSGANAFHGFFIAAGEVSIGNLTLSQTRSQGGAGAAGYYGGGGGAGLGGAVFVGASATVALDGVTFSGASARGGNGGNGQPSGANGCRRPARRQRQPGRLWRRRRCAVTQFGTGSPGGFGGGGGGGAPAGASGFGAGSGRRRRPGSGRRSLSYGGSGGWARAARSSYARAAC